MPSIRETVDIRAEPEAVFDLIARIEDFPLYADFIREVRVTGDKTSHWTAQILGLSLEWDAVVTECHRPRQFAWQSVSGAASRGSYTLERVSSGTRVSFSMEYRFPKPFIERALGPFAGPFAHRKATRVLAKVKQRLEGPQGRDRS